MFNSVGPTVHVYYVHSTVWTAVEIVVQEVLFTFLCGQSA